MAASADRPAADLEWPPRPACREDHLLAELHALAGEPSPATDEQDGHLGSFCPECGWDVTVDEDGCCAGCGATAVGLAVDELVRQRQKPETLMLERKNDDLAAHLAAVTRERDEIRAIVGAEHNDLAQRVREIFGKTEARISDLEKALRSAAEALCSLRCPSTWRTGQPQPHINECEAARAALSGQ